MLKSYLSKLSVLALMIGMSIGTFAQNVTINSPSSIGGIYNAPQAAFGGWSNGETADLVLADDGTGVSNGCTIINDMTGKIALVDRGVCGFAIKAANAQAAGAIAVIVCNNLTAWPDSVILMGGADCNVTIPAVMIGLADCNTIKMELANGPVNATLADNYPGLGNALQAEIELPGAGTYTADTLVGQQLFTDGGSAKYYKITAPMDAVMNVNSCLGGADTRVTVLQGCRNTITAASILGQNEDFCEMTAGGDPYASSVDVIVHQGEEYIIVWDSTYSSSGFDFNVSFGALPMTDVTFNVNMQEETVAPDGVKIIINGGPELDMTNTSGSIYSYTATFTAGDVITFVYLNGSGNPEDSTTQADCRTGEVGLVDGATIPYCFNTCNICPVQTNCPSPDAIICDNFDAYAAGSTTGTNAPHWSTWSGAVGGAEDGIVDDEQAFSAPNSMLIQEGGNQDVLLLLGELTTGVYSLSWKAYIPTGKTGYYNIQNEETPGVQWNLDVAFGTTIATTPAQTPGVGVAQQNTINTNFSFPYDTWFDVRHIIDLDQDTAHLYINGSLVLSWAYTGNIGAVDFYSFATATNRMWVDDILYETKPGNICGGAIPINSLLGGDVDEVLSSPLVNNTGYTEDIGYDPTEGYDCFGEPDGGAGAPELNNTIWFTFVGDGETYLFETGQCGATDYIEDGDTQMAVYTGECGDLAPVGCNEDSPNATTGNYISGLEVATTAGTVYYIMVDGFSLNGALSDGEFCLNATRLTDSTPDVPVTFQVDMTWEIEQGMPVVGVKIAGNFTTNGAAVVDWDPTMSPVFTSIGNDIYEVTIDFPATSVGQTLQYKFLNTANSWGDCGDEQECFTAFGPCTTDTNPSDINRSLVIPATATTICYTYNTCDACNLPNSTTEIVEIPMTIAPNPFSDKAIVTFNTPIVNGEARLTSLTGQMVRNYQVDGTQLTILKNELVPGIYFLNVVTENGISAAQKLIVQ